MPDTAKADLACRGGHCGIVPIASTDGISRPGISRMLDPANRPKTHSFRDLQKTEPFHSQHLSPKTIASVQIFRKRRGGRQAERKAFADDRHGGNPKPRPRGCENLRGQTFTPDIIVESGRVEAGAEPRVGSSRGWGGGRGRPAAPKVGCKPGND